MNTDQQKVKGAIKLVTDGQSVARPKKPVSQPCQCCGSKSHSSGLEERREKCPAFNVNCQKCGKIGYFGPCCLAPVKASEAIVDQDGDLGLFGSVGDLGGNAFPHYIWDAVSK